MMVKSHAMLGKNVNRNNKVNAWIDTVIGTQRNALEPSTLLSHEHFNFWMERWCWNGSPHEEHAPRPYCYNHTMKLNWKSHFVQLSSEMTQFRDDSFLCGWGKTFARCHQIQWFCGCIQHIWTHNLCGLSTCHRSKNCFFRNQIQCWRQKSSIAKDEPI